MCVWGGGTRRLATLFVPYCRRVALLNSISSLSFFFHTPHTLAHTHSHTHTHIHAHTHTHTHTHTHIGTHTHTHTTPCCACRLENTNIFEFPIKWAKGSGLDPQNDPTHSEYLQSLLTTSIDFLLKKITTAAEWYREHFGTELCKEALFHGHLCQEKAKQFRVSGQVPGCTQYFSLLQ